MRVHSFIVLLLVLGCASQTPSGPKSRVDNVFLAPVNAFAPLDTALQPGADRAFEEVMRQLAAREIGVHTKTLFKFRTATNAVMEAGRSEDEGLVEGADPEFRALFAKLGEEVEFEALIIPEVVMRSVKLDGRSGKWDGVRRRQAGSLRFRWSGTSSAPSLRVRVYDNEGRLVADEFGGLDLIFWPNVEEERMELVESPISDMKNIREGVEIALSSFLSSIAN